MCVNRWIRFQPYERHWLRAPTCSSHLDGHWWVHPLKRTGLTHTSNQLTFISSSLSVQLFYGTSLSLCHVHSFSPTSTIFHPKVVHILLRCVFLVSHELWATPFFYADSIIVTKSECDELAEVKYWVSWQQQFGDGTSVVWYGQTGRVIIHICDTEEKGEEGGVKRKRGVYQIIRRGL